MIDIKCFGVHKGIKFTATIATIDCISNFVGFHNSLFLPGTAPGRRVISLTRYKGKDNFYISKTFSHIFAKKLHPVYDGRPPKDSSGRQSAFKGNVGFPVLAQFKPMLVFGSLHKHTAHPGRVAGNVCVYLSHQNSFGCGSSSWALSVSNSFSKRLDSSKISGLRNVKNRRCVCRTCATNRTYSTACSVVIFSKFWICGHFGVSIRDLSFFWFRSFYGRFCGLSGRASSFALFLSLFGDDPGGLSFLFLFGRVVAPKERPGSGPVIERTQAAQMVVNVVFVTEWATAGNGRENLRRHIYLYSTISTGPSISRATLMAASSALARVENKALCFWDDAQ